MVNNKLEININVDTFETLKQIKGVTEATNGFGAILEKQTVSPILKVTTLTYVKD
ncbi:hypothetical protein [Bacillus cereus group sp. MYBK111-1]